MDKVLTSLNCGLINIMQFEVVCLGNSVLGNVSKGQSEKDFLQASVFLEMFAL